jgi:HEPN domain-containing protein
MTEFTKVKMAFTVALLAAAFILQPVIEQIATGQMSVVGVRIDALYAYYAFSGLLALAAYFFGLELVTGRPVFFTQRVGNAMYALAILVPPAYVMLIVIGWMGEFLYSVTEYPYAVVALQAALAIVAGFAAGTIFVIVRRQLVERDTAASITHLGQESTALLTKANGLFEAGLYDLVLMELFRAVEASLKRALLAKDVAFQRISTKELVSLVERNNLLTTEQLAYVQDMRVLRNDVVHESKNVTRDAAERSLMMTRRIITSLDKIIADLETDQIDPNGKK